MQPEDLNRLANAPLDEKCEESTSQVTDRVTDQQLLQHWGVSSSEDLKITDSWPTLDEAALYGLPGQFVTAVEPFSEADPVGILLTLLAALGSIVRSARKR